MKITLFYLLCIPLLGFTQNPTTLMITEIADPQNSSSAGRYVELYNPSSSDIDLSTGYALVRWTNYSANPQSAVPLNGIISADGFFVVLLGNNFFLFLTFLNFNAGLPLINKSPFSL